MNLTILRELLGLYRHEPTSNAIIDEQKLSAVCEKIKDKPSKSASPQLAPLCWNLLIQINRHPPQTFSNPQIFSQTAKVTLRCAKIVEAAEKELDMDLDKMLANVLVKLTEGIKVALEHYASVVEELMELFFERLHKHFNHNLEIKIRRMSLAEMPCINDPFANINLHSIAPGNTQDPVLKQLATVALESLCRLILIFQKGPLESVLSSLQPFHAETGRNVSHFVSSICKLEFWEASEWIFWYWLSDHKSIYSEQLTYFKRRCHLGVSLPTDPSRLNIKLVSALLASNQLVDTMLDVALNSTDVDDEIIGSCLGLVIKEECHVHVESISKIIDRVHGKELSDSGLKLLLPALDSLRNGLFHLTRSDKFIDLFSILNECLLDLKLPVKFYVSWTSSALKSAIDNKKHLNIANLQKLVRGSVAGLMRSYQIVPEDMKIKVHKIIGQTLSTGADIQSLQTFLDDLKGSLGLVLEHSVFNLPSDYFNELSRLIFKEGASDENMLMLWVKVLSVQINSTPKAFNANSLDTLHVMSKLISTNIFDQLKQSQYLEYIYDRVRELGYKEDLITLCKQLTHFKCNKRKFGPKCFYSDPQIQTAVDIVSSFLETGQFVAENFCSFQNLAIRNCVERDLYSYLINLALVHASVDDFKKLVSHFSHWEIAGIQLFCAEDSYVKYGPEVSKLHALYLKGCPLDALKLGYEKLKSSLKSGIENTLQTVELISYLHRLSVSTNNLSESKYFLKQLFNLAETVKSENVKKLAEDLQNELGVLAGNSLRFMSYAGCEDILRSSAYRAFTFEHNNLMELEKFRIQIRTRILLQSPITCNGVRHCESSTSDSSVMRLDQALRHLKLAQEHLSSYYVGEWAKICLLLQYELSFTVPCDSQLLILFELARNCQESGDSSDLNRLKGSIGIFHDEFLSILWFLVVTVDSKFLLFKINLNLASFSGQMQKIHEICSNSTDSLRNTMDIANNPEMKAKWWKLRKSLDSELISICAQLNDEMFANVSELLIPGSESLISRNLHSQLNELLANHNVYIAESLAGQLTQWGQCPKRFKIESLVKMFRLNLASEELDLIIIKIRKCFENCFDVGIPTNTKPLGCPFNLILGKDLNILPFESFPLFNKFTFKRTPLALTNKTSLPPSESFEKVFYIVNPSGDLYQTQERFEGLFKGQPSWEGVIGRKPTADEFFSGICGIFDLFIYFGHSGGEIYAPLKELKKRLSNKSAASALLIGCSSGRIKSNGIFAAESSVFHYLENESPLVLANLWDVTDKDIDMYIKRVLEDSDLLVPIGIEKTTLTSTANTTTIIEKAHLGRQECFLKGLNGYAPIVYGLI